jgi:hypothetical protein
LLGGLKTEKHLARCAENARTEKSPALRRANLHLRQSRGAAWSCRWPGRPPARQIRREELNGVEKDRSIRPLGRARAAALVCGLGSGMQCSRLLVSVGVAAKSFVSRRCSNFIFPRPHKLFRRAVYFSSKGAAGAQSTEARHSWPTKTLAASPLVGIWVSADIDSIRSSFG